MARDTATTRGLVTKSARYAAVLTAVTLVFTHLLPLLLPLVQPEGRAEAGESSPLAPSTTEIGIYYVGYPLGIFAMYFCAFLVVLALLEVRWGRRTAR